MQRRAAVPLQRGKFHKPYDPPIMTLCRWASLLDGETGTENWIGGLTRPYDRKGLSYLAVKLFSKNSNLCEYGT